MKAVNEQIRNTRHRVQFSVRSKFFRLDSKLPEYGKMVSYFWLRSAMNTMHLIFGGIDDPR